MEAVSIKANLPARPAYKASKYIVPNQQVPCEMIQRPRPLVAGNWKMNGTRSSSHSWAKYMSRLAATKVLGCDIAVSPPAPLLDLVARALGATTTIALCGQDCAPQDKGAHTGDISAAMLAEVGCRYVLVGHSERRNSHGETSTLVKAKASMALAYGLIPIICVGETQAERNAGRAISVVRAQISRSLPERTTELDVVIAYEPVWAIGTGRVPLPAEICEMHDSIRELLTRRMNKRADVIPLLYGGSVGAMNAEEIMSLQNVDGALVGGASLKDEEFWGICVTCDNLKSDSSGNIK